MLSRSVRCALRHTRQQPAGRRGLASPASGSFNYELGEAASIKYAARDIAGPTTSLALVAQAGTRFETLPGLTVGLQSYGFKVGSHLGRLTTSVLTNIRAPNAAPPFGSNANQSC